MTYALRHRGPDDEGYWADPPAGYAVGHRRLSIIDLSPLGRQPMASWHGRYVVAFNGEIYNFRELRAELEGLGEPFRGGSDTEVMLAAFSRWGVLDGMRRLAGMFALALWDREEQALHLVRDRLGEKPLYYGWIGRCLVFASELRALRRHPRWGGEIDPRAVGLYLRHNYVPAPLAIFRGFHKVRPGTVVTIRQRGGGAETEERRYWSAADAMKQGLASPLHGSDEEIASECDALLRRVVHREMTADVPLGAFLSGGVDSSLVVALMQAQSARAVRTFTIAFPEPRFDESAHASAVALRLGTDHTQLSVTAAETLAAVPRMAATYDEPFADSSQIPTLLLAALARQEVTVSLSGDGGDELFAGYDHYYHAQWLWSGLRVVPLGARRAAASSLRRVMSRPSGAGGERVLNLAALLDAPSLGELYREVMSHCRYPGALTLAAAEPASEVEQWNQQTCGVAPIDQMMYLDQTTFLPDDILVKVDRATMAVSLESRAPLLDHTVAEFAWRVPLRLKRRDGRGKWLLRHVLERYLPADLVNRRKQGFGVPIASWLRGPLREWAGDLLSESRIRRRGLLRADAVTALWRAQQAGRSRRHSTLWAVLMLEAWMEHE
jgi:asparagine synthase (glutamine-hydrolysing)